MFLLTTTTISSSKYKLNREITRIWQIVTLLSCLSVCYIDITEYWVELSRKINSCCHPTTFHKNLIPAYQQDNCKHIQKKNIYYEYSILDSEWKVLTPCWAGILSVFVVKRVVWQHCSRRNKARIHLLDSCNTHSRGTLRYWAESFVWLAWTTYVRLTTLGSYALRKAHPSSSNNSKLLTFT